MIWLYRTAGTVVTQTNKYFSNQPLSFLFSRVSLGVNLHTPSLLSLSSKTSEQLTLCSVCVRQHVETQCFSLISLNYRFPLMLLFLWTVSYNLLYKSGSSLWTFYFFFRLFKICKLVHLQHNSWCMAMLCLKPKNIIWIQWMTPKLPKILEDVWLKFREEVCNMMYKDSFNNSCRYFHCFDFEYSFEYIQCH